MATCRHVRKGQDRIAAPVEAGHRAAAEGQLLDHRAAGHLHDVALVTTKRVLALDLLLDEDSTFYGDLFPHVVEWDDSLYLEDGLHRAVRAALQQRTSIHARVYVLTGGRPGQPPASRATAPRPAR